MSGALAGRSAAQLAAWSPICPLPAAPHRDHTVLIAPSGPDHGSLLPGECPKAEAQLERVLSLQKKTIHTLTGPQMSIPSAEKYTPRQTWDLVQSATVPTYTTNNVTFQHTARFFAVRGDLLERAKDVYNRNTGAAIQYSEDIIFGSVGSFSYIHLDDAPALPVRVTVIRGEKRFAAWPFDPQTELPAALPYKGSRDRRGSLIDVTASNWERIDEYAAQHGGFSVVLKPGVYSCMAAWLHGCC